MARRQTNLRGPKDKQPSAKFKRRTGRSLNALAIAESEFSEKLQNHRGHLDEDEASSAQKRKLGQDRHQADDRHNKRRRTDDDSSELSENGGSDDEGHRWRLGEVDSDDDSEVDSDEAMGSSDEERFEGFTFRGSSTMKAKLYKKNRRKRDISLSEDMSEQEDGDSEEHDEDDLGSNAVDLTTAWDMNAAEEEAERTAAKSIKAERADPSSGSEYESEADDDSDEVSDSSDFSVTDDEHENADENGLARLQNFVNSMNTEPANETARTSSSNHHQGAPTEYGLTASRKLTVADLLPSITDSRLKSSLKHVNTAASSRTPGSRIPEKLDAPLPKRQQDRLDRAAAYEKSKEALDRWVETVKANRRAEHLSFPLPDPDVPQTKSLATVQPQTDLESTIQNILLESGLVDADGKSAEDQIQEFEELQARKLPIEEIMARRAELRKRRDLLFREEVRAKRIKKIKSRSYRRIHRKEREKLEQQERQALIEAGVDLEEEEREQNERRRAEARMGAKHRESKWAKSLKQTGRTAWDDDARIGAAELSLREEELRKRVEGKKVTHGNEDYLDSSSSDSDEEDPWQEDDADTEERKIREKLSALEEDEDALGDSKRPHSKLMSMKFMKNAEASRKAENDAEIRKLQRELDGEESQSESGSEGGRRKFGVSAADMDASKKAKSIPRNEFEEAPDSEVDEGSDVDIAIDRPVNERHQSPAKRPPMTYPKNKADAKVPVDDEENPWLVQTNRKNRRLKPESGETVDISFSSSLKGVNGEGCLPDCNKTTMSVSRNSKNGNSELAASQKDVASESDHTDDENSVPVLLKNHDLVKRAFAGDEVVQEFEQEKLDIIEDEGDKVIDNTLPGWGSWTGEGISKKQQKRQKRFLTAVDGVKPENRRDAKLAKVIINEKRVKKNIKYMATQLPHPFETRQQYERSLRVPIGPEWSTKAILQDTTKPRVMIKQGIIKPMEKPLL